MDVSKYLELSSRLQNSAALSDNPSAYGGSCNTYVIEDTIRGADGISEAVKWALDISAGQGAPTLVFNNIRPKGSLTSRGIVTSGVCSLILNVFEGAMKWARRPGKKNTAVVYCLDLNHPDAMEFMSSEFTSQLSVGFLTVLVEPEMEYNPTLIEALIDAYENKRVFINKYGYGEQGQRLYPNVCNEIRQPHKGVCTLAAIKLHEMADLNVGEFADAFAQCAQNLIDFLPQIKQLATDNPDLFVYEPQVGLGFVGMANFIAKLGTTYQEVVEAYDGSSDNDAANRFWKLMRNGIMAGSIMQRENGVSRMWTAQPTAHTALRLTDSDGYAVAPELSPVIKGVRAKSDGMVRVHRKSTTDETFDKTLTYAPGVQCQEDVDYETYRKFCNQLMDVMIQCTGSEARVHTFSHLYYGGKFTADDFATFMDSNLLSLYYRIEPTLSQRDKTELIDNAGDISDLFEDNDLFEDSDELCPIDPYERTKCEACSM